MTLVLENAGFPRVKLEYLLFLPQAQTPAMSEAENCDDPWQTPSSELDPELLTTSQRLMAKSDRQVPASEFQTLSPEAEAARQKIVELELQQQRIFQRNVSLTAEVARLRAQNQRLVQELAQFQQQQPQPKSSWFRQIFRR
ncbi:hypothetical protein [Acaryochloris sp. IP29b_bin.137]|uniref:hypothetical protein n=1 Tax=Acaryochloris sp. IP29b_bin.137 TaxID=2969217 RepID=UPI002603ACCB|nr:hypothetical protein [Acaryochloris sp. IP29b_bin.137]